MTWILHLNVRSWFILTSNPKLRLAHKSGSSMATVGPRKASNDETCENVVSGSLLHVRQCIRPQVAEVVGWCTSHTHIDMHACAMPYMPSHFLRLRRIACETNSGSDAFIPLCVGTCQVICRFVGLMGPSVLARERRDCSKDQRFLQHCIDGKAYFSDIQASHR